MTKSHRNTLIIFSLLVAFVLAGSGCAPSKSQFRTSFLPPSPRGGDDAGEIVVTSEPRLDPSLYTQEMPVVIPAATLIPPHSPEIENRLRDAEEKFDAGKMAYQQGNMAEARRQFNRAVDILLSAPESAPERARLERRLDKMVDAIFRYDVNGMGSGEDADKVVYDKSPLDGILEMTFPTDPSLKPKVKEEVAATVSQLPLEENDSVISYIHFFSTERGRKILTAGFRRAGRYRPLIQRILEEEGVPQELIYLAQIESGFLPRAVSYKSAVGMWQFVKWRGQEYGLTQTSVTDDRLDPEKATRAAARHLKDLYSEFGDWYLALAAYNCGPGCVDHAVQRTGYADFWKLRELHAIPKDTENYVPVILAVTIMAKNAKDYGLDGVDADAPMDYDTLALEAPTNLALVADVIERPVSEVRELNPSLLKGSAPAGYPLHVPKGTVATLTSALDQVPAASRANSRMHRVERGETLAAIARLYGSAPSAISAANNNIINAPEAGDLLIIPAAYHESVAARQVSRSSARSHSPAGVSKHRRGTSSHARSVPTQILNHRASSPRMKTAAVRSASVQR
jgi:membrane-bound lytic murein transglycosylase D